MQTFVIHRWLWRHVLTVLLLATAVSSPGATFQLVTGEQLEGEPIAPDARGVIIKKADGSLTERIGWTNFTQPTLQQLAKTLPRLQKILEPFLAEDEPEPVKKARREIKFTPPPRLARPPPNAGIGNLFASPLSVALLLAVYLANLYAAYEIALFRNQPPALVIGAAAIAPFIAPIIFLSMPSRTLKTELAPIETQEEAAYQQAIAMEQTASAHEQHGSDPEGVAPEPQRPAQRHPPPTVYQRGTTMFNRRFFETKLSGFLRMVPGEAEKDMVVCVKSGRGEHVGQRLTRVLPNELYLQVIKAGASSEVAIPYTEIQEVRIRHKDAA